MGVAERLWVCNGVPCLRAEVLGHDEEGIQGCASAAHALLRVIHSENHRLLKGGCVCVCGWVGECEWRATQEREAIARTSWGTNPAARRFWNSEGECERSAERLVCACECVCVVVVVVVVNVRVTGMCLEMCSWKTQQTHPRGTRRCGACWCS